MATAATKQVIAAIMVSLVVGAAGASLWLDRESRTVERFHQIYHDMSETTWDQNTHWLGTRLQKLPMDLQVYQELLWDTKPDVLLEMGTLNGGSALYFASIFDLMGHGRVITVDIERQPNLPAHPRIAYMLGSSTSPELCVRSKPCKAGRDGDGRAGFRPSRAARPPRTGNLQPHGHAGPVLSRGGHEYKRPPGLEGMGPGPAEATAEFLAGNRNSRWIVRARNSS